MQCCLSPPFRSQSFPLVRPLRSSGDDEREHIRHAGWVPDALLVHPGIGPLQLCSAFISPEYLAQAAA